MEFPKLLSPIKIGSLEVKNRFVVPSMGIGRAEYSGFLNENVIQYYVERAKGGFGLIITEVVGIDPAGKAMPEQIMIDDDKYIPGLKEFTDRVHEAGGKIFPQIHHAGRQASWLLKNNVPVAPSAVPCPLTHNVPRELTNAEVYAFIEKYGDACARAKEAGFDGIELQCGHGYLIAQFLSGYSNKRDDEFGGTFINRAKFALDIIANIRKKCGPDFPICTRLSADERVHGGLKPHDTAAIAALFEKAGVDAINVTTSCYGNFNWIITPNCIEPGFNLDDTQVIKNAVNIPVMAVGRLNDPYFCETVISSGIADMVCLGRGSIADPHLPNKVRENRINEILQCVGCMTRCQSVVPEIATDRGISCMVNPFSAQEYKRKITPAAIKKNVVVVGGGPGGLEAAWIAAARGHNVTLFEKSGKLGGQFLPAAAAPGKHVMLGAIRYYFEMCKKHGVDIKLNTEADENIIAGLKPDEVILATGAVPLKCPFPVKTDIPVIQATDVLTGTPVGNNVLIVGGGMVGIETAEYLVTQLRSIMIVEMLEDIGIDMQTVAKYFALKTLADNNVAIMRSTKVKEINSEGAVCLKSGEEIKLNGFDTIVMAIGSHAYNPLEEKLKGKVKSVHIIGDAVKARKAVEAIEEATALALSI